MLPQVLGREPGDMEKCQVSRLPVLPLGHVVGLQSDDPLYLRRDC